MTSPAASRGGDGHSSSVALPSRMTNTSSSSEWQCGGEPRAPGASLLPVKPRELRTLRRRQRRRRHAVLKALELDLVDVEDVRRPRRRFAVSERLACGLDVPGVVVASLDPRPPEPDRARARQPADFGRVTRAESEVLEPLLARDERVLVLVGAVDHTVARSYLVDVPVLPGEPRAGEHEEDLLGGRVRVGRRRQHPGRDAHTVHADGSCSGDVAEPLPRCVHLSLRAAEAFDLVPVRERHDSEFRRRNTS